MATETQELYCLDCQRAANTECKEQKHRTSASPKHSPLPWAIEEQPSDYIDESAESHFTIVDAPGYSIALTVGDTIPCERGNAELIIEAVNACAALVAQREQLLQIARDSLSFRVEVNGHCDHDTSMVKLCSQCEIRDLLTTIESEDQNQ